MKRILVALLLLSSLVFAGKHVLAPLPEKIFSAKTVFIENQTGFQEAADHCYEALSKWGKYQVVDSKSKAALVFLLTGTRERRGATGQVIGNQVYETDIRRSVTSLFVVDATTGDTLWQETASAPHGSRAGTLVDKLRQRVDETRK